MPMAGSSELGTRLPTILLRAQEVHLLKGHKLHLSFQSDRQGAATRASRTGTAVTVATELQMVE